MHTTRPRLAVRIAVAIGIASGITIGSAGDLGGGTAWATNGFIAIAFTPDFYSCQMSIPCGCRGTLYIYGGLAGASAGGITGAEYSVQIGPNSSPDPGWLFSESFPSGALVLGSGAMVPADPSPRGVNLAWPQCQTGNGGYILLETVQVLNLGAPGCSNVLPLQVVKHSQPSNQFFQCPLFTLCDAPVYTKVCVGFNVTNCPNPEPPFPNNATCSEGGRGWINPSPSAYCCLSCYEGQPDCTVAVTPASWSAMKELYR